MKKRYIFSGIIALIVIYVLLTLYKANVFKTYRTTENLRIEVITAPPGLEDLTIDQQTGFAYISSHDRRNKFSRGDIYLFKTRDSTKRFINLTAAFPKPDFRPHGISLFSKNDSTKYLFVISHGDDESNTVERFSIIGDELNHINSISSSVIVSPNDIHAISETAFYLTNDHDETKGFIRTIKDFLKIGTGSVVYYNGDNARIVADRIPYANGIHTSKCGDKLFVASTNVNTMLVFNISEANSLVQETAYDTGIGVDNIELDDEGNLYVGCHPQLLKFLSHSKDSTKLSPTIVLKMTYDESEKTFSQKNIYTDDGYNLSGGSVAAVYKKSNDEEVILVGSVFERKLMVLE